jgi:hypothetical protein
LAPSGHTNPPALASKVVIQSSPRLKVGQITSGFQPNVGGGTYGAVMPPIVPRGQDNLAVAGAPGLFGEQVAADLAAVGVMAVVGVFAAGAAWLLVV